MEQGERAAELVREIAAKARERFAARRQIMSFQEYLNEVLADPLRHTRDAALYVRDMFDFYGTREVRGTSGPVRRFRLFDLPFAEESAGLLGQEELQGEVYRQLSSYCEKGRIDKLLMIHGPNGTAKSTFVECIIAGLDDYSRRPEGVLHRFNWIFSDTADRTSLGFHEKPSGRDDESLAYLEPDAISFKISDELKDHPLLLLPREERLGFLDDAFQAADQRPRLPRLLSHGELCAKNAAIFRALSNAYQGDWERIVQHVQVERLYVTQRYRSCAVVIQPQGNVDAAARPLNLEKSYRLPPVLNQSSLHELSGDLVDANRGLVEYSDFFKRRLELSKYLLTTSEKGSISLAGTTAFLDCLLFATANEKNLTLFKRNPDFPSFKGRFELLRAPYLLRWSVEERIYAGRIQAIANHKTVMPHVTRIAALWAVLTRLRQPSAKNYQGAIGSLAARLDPLEKARLYDSGEAPEEWPDVERKELRAKVELIAHEYDNAEEEFEGIHDAAYEGRRGASPREILQILHHAAEDPEAEFLSPQGVLQAIREVIADRSLYEFLRLPARGAYGNVEALTDLAEGEYRRLVRDDVHRALALVEESAYEQLFDDYFQHVRAFDKGEKLRNRVTGRPEAPSEPLMRRVEELAGMGGDPAEERKDLIVRIAAWVIDNPGQPVNYREIFADIFRALRQSYYREREEAIQQVQGQILRYGTDEWAGVEAADQARVVEALERLASYGYDEAGAKEALTYVLRHRGEDA